MRPLTMKVRDNTKHDNDGWSDKKREHPIRIDNK
jgi:hypothetical protein